MPPDPIIGIIAALGLLFYASIAVAIAKSGKPYDYDDNTTLLRISTVVTTMIIWGGLIAYAAWTTDTGNSNMSLESGLIDFGGILPIGTVLLLTLAPCDRELRSYLAVIWPLLYLSKGLGSVGKFVGLNVAKLPNGIGTYIANSVNESKEIAA